MITKLPNFPNIETPPSLREMAYQEIKKSILNQSLKKGCLYSEQAIAKNLGISKTPTHLALAELSNKGFLTIVPRKGVQINMLTPKEVQNLFEFRTALERLVIFDILPKLKDDFVCEIESLVKESSQTQDHLHLLSLDRRFHLSLASLTGNRFVISAMEDIKDLCDWIGAEILTLKDRREEAVREHTAIVDSLRERDLTKAWETMSQHLETSEGRYLEKMKSRGQAEEF
jgi:DNA-binding GntR family transcriptional regulator